MSSARWTNDLLGHLVGLTAMLRDLQHHLPSSERDRIGEKLCEIDDAREDLETLLSSTLQAAPDTACALPAGNVLPFPVRHRGHADVS